jgi:LytS/YehU family sensor histidine kinase
MQTLVENAVKHNTFSQSEPLDVVISVEGDRLTVRNPLRKKHSTRPSSGLGLTKLNDRYRLLPQQSIQVVESGTRFDVHIPVLRPGVA